MPKGIRKGKSQEIIKTDIALPEQYKYYKENNFEAQDSFFYIERKTYSKFLKIFFEKLVNAMIYEGFDFTMPYRTGVLCVRKYNQVVRYDKNGNVDLRNLPVNWDATLKLWEKDEVAKKEKRLIRYLNKDRTIYSFKYFRKTANYKNKSKYSFKATRTNKLKLKAAIKNNLVNCFNLF